MYKCILYTIVYSALTPIGHLRAFSGHIELFLAEVTGQHTTKLLCELSNRMKNST